MRIPSARHAIADVKALGASAPVRALYEASKRTNLHRVLFRSTSRRHFRSSTLSLGTTVPADEDVLERCLADAELIRSQGARVFGNRVPTGFQASWHLDPLSGTKWPRLPWWQIDIRSDKRLSDVKHVWEAGRHRDLVVLARAAAISGDEWLDTLVDALLLWCEENPPETGVHWYSSLELALRAISWAQVLGLVGETLPPNLRMAMDDQLVASARHIVTELPYTVSSMKNNHMLGDALGLIVLSRLFPTHPQHRIWNWLGERLFGQQLARHMRPDGSMVEDSVSYHRFVLEMLIVRDLIGDAPPAVKRAMNLAAHHLQRIGVFDGTIPQYGDWDEGRVLASSGEAIDVAGSTALALALSSTALPDGTANNYDELAWYLPDSKTRRAELSAPDSVASALPSPKAHATTHIATSGGIAYVRRGSWTAWFKVGSGPSHGHADLTSIWLMHQGRWVIADPGTGTYNGPIAIRNGLRTSVAHPVIRPDGRDQLGPHRAFRWQRQAQGRLAPPQNLPNHTVLFGWHDAYANGSNPIRIARTVLIGDDSFAVFDAADHDRTNWHLTLPLHPGIQAEGGNLKLDNLALPIFGLDNAEAVFGSKEPYAGWHSATYGEIEPATWLLVTLGYTGSHLWGLGDIDWTLEGHALLGAGHHLEVAWEPEPTLLIDGKSITVTRGDRQDE